MGWLREIHWRKILFEIALNVLSALILTAVFDNPFSIAMLAFFWGVTVSEAIR